MITRIKIALAFVIVGIVLAALAEEMTGVWWAAATGFLLVQYHLSTSNLRYERDQLLRERNQVIAKYINQNNLAHMTLFEDDQIILNDDHRFTSGGGNTPYICRCGRTFQEHR